MGFGLFGKSGPATSQRQPWFGPQGKYTEKASILGAGLQDMGTALNGGYSGHLDAYRERQRMGQLEEERRAKEAQQRAVLGRLGGVLTGDMGGQVPQQPQQVPPHMPGDWQPAPGGADGAAQGNSLTTNQGLRRGRGGMPSGLPQWMADAIASGVDIGGLDEVLKFMYPEDKAYQGVNMGAAGFGVFDPVTGQYRHEYSPPTKQEKPVYVEGADGIYERLPDGKWKKQASWQQFRPQAPRQSSSSSYPPAGGGGGYIDPNSF